MAIHFYCGCGKRIKARREMAGSITLCPVCGEHVKVPPVNIPTEKGTHPGVSASVKTDAASAARPDRSQHPPEVLVRRQRRSPLASRREQPESGCFDSLLYTLPVLPWLALLAAALAVTSGVALHGLPDFLQSGSRRPLELEIFVPCVLAIPALLCFTTPLLSGILALGMEGSLRIVSPPGFDELLRATAQWTACLAAGPALWLGSAAVYWVYCGDPRAVDWLILGELVALGSGNLLAALVVTSPAGGFRRLHPLALLQSIRLLGWWFAVTSLLAAAMVFGLFGFGSLAIIRLHAAPIEGTLWLALSWFSALAGAAFLFRRLGLSYYHASGRHAPADGDIVAPCRE